MKKLLIIATLAAVGMGACSKDDGVSAPEDLRKYVQVTIPENAASGETRTSVDGTTTSWVAGDKVAVSLYNGSTTEVCEFTADRTGATTTFSGSVPVGSYTCAAAHYPFCAATFDAETRPSRIRGAMLTARRIWPPTTLCSRPCAKLRS